MSNERVSDETLDGIMLAIQAKELVAGACVDVGDRMSTTEAVAIVAELQQHRARIAAHATAHPERLSEDQLDSIESALARDTRQTVGLDMTRKEGRAAIAEIRQRRTTGLGLDDVERLWWLIRKLEDFIGDDCIRDPLRETLERLLRAHGSVANGA